MNTCTVCKSNLVEPVGLWYSKVALVNSHPSEEELQRSTAYVGPVGQVVERELWRCGVQFRSVRATHLWRHAPNDEEIDVHLALMMAELQKKEAALFMGAELAERLTGRSVMEIAGVLIPRKELLIELPEGLETIVFSPSPAIALQRGIVGVVGDFRDALEYFIKSAKKRGINL